MNLIAQTYPEFQSLPQGIQQMLLFSESHFSNQARPRPAHAFLERASPGKSWQPQLFCGIDVPLDGTCGDWGKRTQLLQTLTD